MGTLNLDALATALVAVSVIMAAAGLSGMRLSGSPDPTEDPEGYASYVNGFLIFAAVVGGSGLVLFAVKGYFQS